MSAARTQLNRSHRRGRGLVLALSAAAGLMSACLAAAAAPTPGPAAVQDVSPAPAGASGVDATPESAAPAPPTRGRTIFAHGEPTVYEQLMLELMNRARAAPAAEADRLGIALNDGLPPETISEDPKPPLALHHALIQAARAHSEWMLDTDTFNHTGIDDSSPGDRMSGAGYEFTGYWTWGENISWGGSTGAIDAEAQTMARHASLFRSPGHRTAICNDLFPEVGIGIMTGRFTRNGTTYNALMVTQDYARSSSTPTPYVLGVVFNDENENDFYDVGEGVPDVTVVVEGGGWETKTSGSGGYAIPYAGARATLTVTFTGAFPTSPVTRQIEAAGENVKLDLDTSELQAPPQITLTYRAGNNGTVQGYQVQIVDYGTDGAPVTAVPDDGYRFTKWSDDVLTATRTDIGVTEDLTVTAEFEPAPLETVFQLWVDGNETDPLLLAFGEAPGATDDIDPQFDVPAPGGQPYYFVCVTVAQPDGWALSTDFRPENTTSRWRLVLGNDPLGTVLLTWDVADADAERRIYLQQLDTEQPVGLPVDMREQSAVIVPGNTVFEIAYARPSQLTLDIHRDWNLLGNPIMTTKTTVDILGKETRTGMLPGTIAGWTENAYRQWSDGDALEPERGYWLHSSAATRSNTIDGILADGTIRLNPGWNLVSPVADCPMPQIQGLAGPAWTWNAETQMYWPLPPDSVLIPGKGYWFFVNAAGPVDVRFAEP